MPVEHGARRRWYLRRGYRYHLFLLQILIFALPLLVVLYILQKQNVVLGASHLLLAAMSLVLVLAGMIMLRQIFDRFFGFVDLVEESSRDAGHDPAEQSNTEELRRISFSFGRLMKRFEKTTEELKRRVFELFTIRDLTEVASRVLDIDDLLKELLEKALAVSGARIGSVFFWEPENRRLRIVDHHGLAPGPEKNAYVQINKTMLKAVIQDKKPLLITDIEKDPRTDRTNDPRYGAPSFLAMPIMARSGVIAVLSLANKADGSVFSHDDERILSILIKEIGFAVENATLHSAVETHLQELQESEEKYRSILESIQYGYYETDLEGRLTFFNGTLARMLGASPDEVNGRQCQDYLDRQSVALVRSQASRVLQSGRSCTALECAALLNKGQRRALEMSIFLMRDNQGEPMGFRGVVRDLTEKKKAEAQQRSLETRLQKRQRLEAVGTLAGGVAHNFNNLLMGIQGNAELLQIQQGLAANGERHVATIEKLVKQGARLTAQLLGYARAGKYEPQPMDLNLWVREIADTLASTCKNIRFRQNFAETLPTVIADQGQMTQVVMNVVLNATEAMAKGGELLIATDRVLPAEVPSDDFQADCEAYVRLTFADDGPGMDGETLERAFEPFFTTKDRGQQGRGMGLASVYGIIKAHDGTVDIQSQPGQGTTVSIFLPASDAPIPLESGSNGAAVKGEGTVLLVDDEEIVLDVGATMLRSLDYRVLEASNGRQALDILRAQKDRIDLVVLDMVMPEMSGEEVFEQMRVIQPGIRVLLSSGYSREGQADHLLARGCDGFIQKPFGLKDLARVMVEMMGGG